MTAVTPTCPRHTAKPAPVAESVPRVLTFAVVKRIDPRLPNTWGHWWIELNGEESYGWWPNPCPMGWRGALLGTGGVLNGIGTTDGGTTTTRDAYHGDEPDHCFHPTLHVDKSDDQVLADIRAFARSYTGGFRWQWWWLRQPGENCRTFQDELFATVGLREEPDVLYTRGAGCPFMYPIRCVKWRSIDAVAKAVARMRLAPPMHGRRSAQRNDAGIAADTPGGQRRHSSDAPSLADAKARAQAKIRGTRSPGRAESVDT